MRIAIDVRSLMQPHYSGVSTYTYQLLSRLFAADTENEYQLFFNSAKGDDRYLPKFSSSRVSYKGFRYPNKLLNTAMGLTGQPKLDRLMNDPDVFFFPNIDAMAVSPKTPYALTVHDVSFLRFPEFFDTKRRLRHLLIRPKNIIRKASRIFAVSEHTKKDIVELCGVEPERITVTPLGLPEAAAVTPSDLNRVRNRYKLPNQFILFLGTIEPRKNIQSIIEALPYIDSRFHLVIAGKPGWKYSEIIRSSQQAKGRVHFIDYVDESDKPALYTMASTFVWPSFYEGFGLPPLEAQLYGLPVIVGANSSMVEVIGSSGLIVNVDDVAEISFGVNEILRDPELAERLRGAGKKNVKRFSWDETARLTYDGLISLSKDGKNRN